MFRDDLEGWDEGLGIGEKLKREGIYVFLQLIHVVVQQKLAQQIVMQLYSNLKKEVKKKEKV